MNALIANADTSYHICSRDRRHYGCSDFSITELINQSHTCITTIYDGVARLTTEYFIMLQYVLTIWGPFYQQRRTLIPAWMNSDMHYSIWDIITNLSSNSNGLFGGVSNYTSSFCVDILATNISAGLADLY